MITTYIVVALAAYLLGSIPFGYILVRIFLKQDIRETGSGNIGATNVGRTGRTGLAIATLLLDAGKGALAVILTLGFFMWALIHDPRWTLALGAFAGTCAVVGHMFPVWLKFKGGKGVATTAGAFALLAPRAVLVALAIFLLAVVLTRYVSLGSVLAAIALPVGAHFMPLRLSGQGQGSAQLTILVTMACALVVLKHHGNLRRLVAGTESRLGAKASSAAQMEKQA